MVADLYAISVGAGEIWRYCLAGSGRLPKAFNFPSLGYVDALVMYKWLEISQ